MRMGGGQVQEILITASPALFLVHQKNPVVSHLQSMVGVKLTGIEVKLCDCRAAYVRRCLNNKLNSREEQHRTWAKERPTREQQLKQQCEGTASWSKTGIPQ